jgi:hypothetical protein
MSRRTPWIVAGIVVLVVATPVVIAGIVLLALFGSRGDLRSGPHQVTTPGRALISSVAAINDTTDAGFLLGNSRLELDGTARDAGHGVFVGIAPAAAVDRYLAGADVDVVSDFDLAPFSLTTDRRPGTAAPAAPGAQDFWVARAEASSGTASLSWIVRDGDYRVVIMNADASPAVDVDGTFGVVIPRAFGLSMAVLVTGLVMGVLGVALLLVGLLQRGRPTPPAPTAPAGARPPVAGPVPAQTAPAATPAPAPTGPPATGREQESDPASPRA